MTLDGGVLSGAGSLFANLVNNGAAIRPGSNIGAISVSGDYTQGAGGTLELDIAGAPGSGQFDVLHVGGTATLDGTCRLAVGGFVGSAGDEYDVLTYASRSGTFATIADANNQNGVTYVEEYQTGQLRFTVFEAAGLLAEKSPDSAESFAEWSDEWFGKDVAPEADPDRDGMANFLEYALGSDPLEPDASEPLVAERATAEDGRQFVELRCRVRAGAADVSPEFELSDDGTNWVSAPEVGADVLEDVGLAPDPSNRLFETVTCRLYFHAGSAADVFRFVRLRFTPSPEGGSAAPRAMKSVAAGVKKATRRGARSTVRWPVHPVARRWIGRSAGDGKRRCRC
jgi:hypothetical protein